MSRAAIRYAKAILDIAQTSGKAEAVNNDMKSIITAVAESTELKDFLSSPVIKMDVKKSAISEIFSNVQAETQSLFNLLFENKRFEILGNIASEYNNLFDEMNNIEIANITTAMPMDKTLEAKVLEKIATFSNKKITIENTVDESIIGGFILRIGDKQYNASVANRLQVLKRELAN